MQGVLGTLRKFSPDDQGLKLAQKRLARMRQMILLKPAAIFPATEDIVAAS
jgi:hypothetical protein